jgi:hypothetical protein
MKAGELQEAGIDAPHGAAIAERHGGDQVALEPLDRVARRELVHLGRIDPGVDGPGHQRHAARLGPMTPLSHDGDGGEHGDAGLAHRDDVGLGSHRLEESDDVGDVVVEAERPGGERHVARIVPVGQVHVVIGEHGADGAAQERGEVPDMGATRSTRGWSPATSFRKRSKLPKGVRSTTSSLTATSRRRRGRDRCRMAGTRG